MNGKNANLQDLAYYDSTAGMGKFTIDIRKKWIEVEKSFLTYNTNFTQSGKTACIFLEGYFEGILSGFLEKDLKVREVKCVSRGDSVCRFEIDENAIYIEDLEFVGKDKNIYKFMLSKKETTPIDNSNQVQKEGPLQQ